MRILIVGLVVILLYKFVNKDSLIYVIDQSLPGKEAGLLAGMLLGVKTGFERNFYQDLINTGLVHIVVVSGTNIMLIARGLVDNLAGYLGRKKTIVGVLVLLWSYAAMVGWEAPVVRALLMASVYYWAQLLGRKYDWPRGMGLAVILMLMADVRMVTSVSFYLSIGAFLGVMTVKDRWLTVIGVSLWITPILAMIFGKISLITPVANIMVMMVVEVITIIGGIGAVVGVFVPVLGKIIIWLVYPMLKYFVVVVEGLAGLSWSVVEIKFNWLMVVGWYLILIYFLIRKRNEY